MKSISSGLGRPVTGHGFTHRRTTKPWHAWGDDAFWGSIRASALFYILVLSLVCLPWRSLALPCLAGPCAPPSSRPACPLARSCRPLACPVSLCWKVVPAGWGRNGMSLLLGTPSTLPPGPHARTGDAQRGRGGRISAPGGRGGKTETLVWRRTNELEAPARWMSVRPKHPLTVCYNGPYSFSPTLPTRRGGKVSSRSRSDEFP